MPNFMKIRPVGAELFHENGQTDMKLIVTFRNFAKAPEKKKKKHGPYIWAYILRKKKK